MNYKKLFTNGSIIIGVAFLVVIVLLIVNSSLIKCDEGHEKNKEEKLCYYNVTSSKDCVEGEDFQSVDKVNTCSYPAETFMNNKVFTWLLFSIGGIWVIVFVVFLVSMSRTDKTIELSSFRKEDFITAERAQDLWAMEKCKSDGIPVTNNDYKRSAFDFYRERNTFQKGREWFVKFQCEVKEGEHPGIYTAVLSLSRGEKWISGGMQNWKQCNYDEYAFKHGMPIHTPENAQERMIEQMMERYPERAIELQEQLLEKGAMSAAQTQEVSQQPVQQVVQQRTYGRRPWYSGRGRYYVR